MIRVLIADDHEMIRNGLSSLIRGESDIHVIDTASNGKQAVELCGKREIDVVLMDIMMPEMNGVEATRNIKLRCPETKVLADDWTAVTKDKSYSAQFEHSVGVTSDGVEIFTLSPAGTFHPTY